jgi:hypothetical protein
MDAVDELVACSCVTTICHMYAKVIDSATMLLKCVLLLRYLLERRPTRRSHYFRSAHITYIVYS